MRAEITEYGTLKITPEHPVEEYALIKWSEENLNPEHGTFTTERFVIIGVFKNKESKAKELT